MTANPANSQAAPADVLFGVAGWSYSDWEGMVYPAGASGESKMLTVAAACDLLEINTTFYNTPRPGVAQAWARRLERTGLPTRLVVKLNRVFTHEESFTRADVRAVLEMLAPLDDSGVIDRDGVEQPRLLGLLVQFPYFFRLTPEATARLEQIAEAFPDHTRFLELRHQSWNRPVTWDWMRKRNYAAVNIDLPSAPRPKGPPEDRTPDDDPPHAFPPRPVVTNECGYLRLHGRNSKAWFDRKASVEQKYDYLYDRSELDGLAERIRDLAGRTKLVAVVGNNHYRGKALATVLNLAHLVEGRKGITLPPPMLETYPALKDFAEPGDPLPAAAAKAPEPKAPRKKSSAAKKQDDDPQLRLFE